jgi:endonuclease YncB( thermonuclease family)
VTALAAALALAAAACSEVEEDGPERSGAVSRVIDGDTVDVALANGKRERVRLVGIDAPERGDCFSRQATAQVRSLALSRRVVLERDAIQGERDRFGRLLAYVVLPNGRDLGSRLLADGYVETFDASFERRGAYRRAEAAARRAQAGLWRACATPGSR